MNKLLRRIGATVIGLVFIAVPVLTTVAFFNFNEWPGLIISLLIVGDICELFVITAIVYERSE